MSCGGGWVVLELKCFWYEMVVVCIEICIIFIYLIDCDLMLMIWFLFFGILLVIRVVLFLCLVLGKYVNRCDV